MKWKKLLVSLLTVAMVVTGFPVNGQQSIRAQAEEAETETAAEAEIAEDSIEVMMTQSELQAKLDAIKMGFYSTNSMEETYLVTAGDDATVSVNCFTGNGNETTTVYFMADMTGLRDTHFVIEDLSILVKNGETEVEITGSDVRSFCSQTIH